MQTKGIVTAYFAYKELLHFGFRGQHTGSAYIIQIDSWYAVTSLPFLLDIHQFQTTPLHE